MSNLPPIDADEELPPDAWRVVQTGLALALDVELEPSGGPDEATLAVLQEFQDAFDLEVTAQLDGESYRVLCRYLNQRFGGRELGTLRPAEWRYLQAVLRQAGHEHLALTGMPDAPTVEAVTIHFGLGAPESGRSTAALPVNPLARLLEQSGFPTKLRLPWSPAGGDG